MPLYPAALLKLVPPAAAICAMFVGRAYVDRLDDELRIILDYLPYLICLVATLMAYLFSRSRLMLASLGIATCYWAVQTYLQVSLDDPGAIQAYLAISLAVPVLGLYLLMLPERGIWNLYGLVFTLAFIVLGFTF